jgi:hypothetical protein
MDSSAKLPGGAGEGIRSTRWIHISLLVLIECGLDSFGVDDRGAALDLRHGNEFGRNAVALASALKDFQFLDLILRAGERHASAGVISHRLLAFLFDDAIELSRVSLQYCGTRRRRQRKQASRRVPGGPGGEFLTLQQYDVAPTHLGQVIENGASGDAAANYNDTGLIQQNRAPCYSAAI